MTCSKKSFYEGDEPAIPRPNLSQVPQQLQEQRRWVCWKLERENPQDRWTKVPYTISGRNAKSNAPKTWSTFAEVVSAYETGGYHGIGFMLGDGFSGVDLDDCRDSKTGAIDPDASQIVEQLGSYAEVSPSGTGLKVFCLGTWNGSRNKTKIRQGLNIECYEKGLFFCVTGIRIGDIDTLKDAQQTLNALATEMDAVSRKTSSQAVALPQAHPPLASEDNVVE